MEGHLINAELFAKTGEQADERLANGAGADYMYDSFWLHSLPPVVM